MTENATQHNQKDAQPDYEVVVIGSGVSGHRPACHLPRSGAPQSMVGAFSYSLNIFVRSSKMTCHASTVLLVTSLALVSGVFAGETYSPPVNQTFPDNVYWGDTHVHTSFSSHDANIGGKNRVSPEIAYRFARGESVTANNGMAVQLQRPLDFLVVADHAEGLGVAFALQSGDPAFPNSELGTKFRDAYARYIESGEKDRTLSSLLWGQPIDASYRHTLWQRVVGNAEKYNDPGKFTAFTGFEWSAAGLLNLHRVVIFKDGADKTAQTTPFSQSDSNKPEDLWNYLERYQTETKGQVIAIPHNPNVSGGEMFATHKFGGAPLNAEWLRLRSQFEPLMEITQFKGDSEAHPLLSPTDEFADFETWNSWNGRRKADPRDDVDTPEEMITRKRGEYAREALKTGLALKATTGVNPFKVGIIGSTDSHTSLSTPDSNNFWGKFSREFPGSELRRWDYSAGGYAGIWATENTRQALFAAMQRRETYATTGPRINLRFFAGWDYDSHDAQRSDLASLGYAGGVPMGGDLTGAPVGKSPSFLIRAVRDPVGANLDRVQVVKGWRDKEGELHEKIHDVALSDGRRADVNGNVPAVGSTVDVSEASYRNSIGDPALAVVWTDPDFDRDELAFYYLRVLEIPTPRWTAYDAKFFATKDLPVQIDMVTQQRAYTSPIWYTPAHLK